MHTIINKYIVFTQIYLLYYYIYIIIFLACTYCVYCRSGSSSNLPPKPPMRPRHTLKTIETEGDGDVFDGGIDARRESLSPSYIDPTELNTNLRRGGSLE